MSKFGMEAVKAKTTVTKLANALGITPGAVSQWTQVPAERVGEVARITKLRPEVIRPDIFAKRSPQPDMAAAS